MNQNLILPILALSFLTACGGSSSSDKKVVTPKVKEPVVVTSENIAKAVTITGASPTNVETKQVPADLKTVASSSVDSVVVSANSNFSLELSVPAADVPAGKFVAGYLIEMAKDEISFVPVKPPVVTAQGKTIQIDQGTNTAAAKKVKRGSKKQAEAKSISILAEATVGGTGINFAGWGNSDFSLDKSLAELKFRIFPLLTNKAITQALTIEDIDLTDPANWVGVQELALKVEAVATAQIQVSLTWDTKTDLDLWVVGPNGDKITYENPFSNKSLGWLDYDNTDGYGPENITYNYQMPVGDYDIRVHYFDGNLQTNYQVTVAHGDDVKTYKGDFAATEGGDDNDKEGSVDSITKITIDDAKNAALKAPIATSQFQGVWKLPAASSVAGFIEIKDKAVNFYVLENNKCQGAEMFVGDYLTTGFSVTDNKLQVSDALLGGKNYIEGDGEGSATAEFTYAILDVELSTLPAGCVIEEDDED